MSVPAGVTNCIARGEAARPGGRSGRAPGEVSEALSGRRDPAGLLWRFLEAQPGWLLIFDNADDPEVLTVGGNEAGGGAGWLRPSASGLIIVTTRYP